MRKIGDIVIAIDEDEQEYLGEIVKIFPGYYQILVNGINMYFTEDCIIE